MNNADCLFDLAAAVYKKLLHIGQLKECERVKLWARSGSNHVYWVAESSNGDSDVAEAKWESLFYHMTNKHENLPNVNFAACAHPPLEGRERRKAWIEPRMCPS